MFKIVVPSVPHCTAEFIKWSGFEIGATPRFATPFQKWVWADDDADVLWQEFTAMDNKIAAETRPSLVAAPGAQVSRMNA
jgi:hypothetical protein